MFGTQRAKSCRVHGYSPDYAAPIETFLKLLDGHGIEHAVLVQPSFLGGDNQYLLGCLRAYPDRLRGIVVLDPDISGAEIDDMTALGVIGMRYNLLSFPPMWLGKPVYQILTSLAVQRDWWIEVQANGPDWPMGVAGSEQGPPDGGPFWQAIRRALPRVRRTADPRPGDDLCETVSALSPTRI